MFTLGLFAGFWGRYDSVLPLRVRSTLEETRALRPTRSLESMVAFLYGIRRYFRNLRSRGANLSILLVLLSLPDNLQIQPQPHKSIYPTVIYKDIRQCTVVQIGLHFYSRQHRYILRGHSHRHYLPVHTCRQSV